MARSVNSCDTHTDAKVLAMAPADAGAPGSPNRCGRTTLSPRSATRRPNAATRGVMPGTSLMTTTAGPDPVRNTALVLPSAVNVDCSYPSSATIGAS
jgi:hypothetical protein